jgi:DNA-binding transcriptional ArsR family regulator
MDCPQLPDEQSLANGRKRLQVSTAVLGKDVLVRLLIYALYLLGFKRDTLARLFGYQLAGIKSIIERVNSSGLEGLVDRRRSIKEQESGKPEISLTAQDIVIFLPEPVDLKLKQDDLLARKIMATTLADAGIITSLQGAEILEYTPQAFSRLLKRYREKGSTDLVDKRRGQQHDYKVDLAVKSEILYHFLKLSCRNIFFSSKDIHRAVNEAFPEKAISERTIRHYLTMWGFSQVHRRLNAELYQGKKN